MHAELKSLLEQSLDTEGGFFRLFRAAHHLEDLATKSASNSAGQQSSLLVAAHDNLSFCACQRTHASSLSRVVTAGIK